MLVSFVASTGSAFAAQYKYFGEACVGIGDAAKIRSGKPYSCKHDLNTCKAAPDALNKTIKSEHVDIMAAILTEMLNQGKPLPKLECDQEFFVEMLVQGISYSESKKHLPLIKKLIDASAGTNYHTRRALADAMWNIGDKDAIKYLKKLLISERNHGREFKQRILRYMVLKNSDDGVDFCKTQVKTGVHESMRKACMVYLGERKAKGVTKDIVRNMQKYPKSAIWSLGLLGDKSAIKKVKKYLKSNSNNPTNRIPAIVALINLGDKKHVKDLEMYVQGLKPMNEKEQKRFDKAMKKIEKDLKHKKESKRERAQKKKDKLFAKMKKVDPRIAKTAADNVLFLRDAGTLKNITKHQLRMMKAEDEDKWEPKIWAAISLAQRGNADAIKFVAKQINDHDEERVRDLLVSASGNISGVFAARATYEGIGIIKSKSLIAPLLEYIQSQTNATKLSSAYRSIVNIRAVTR